MLKKKFSKLSALFMIGSLLLGGAFFGCSSGGGDDSTYYTVKYDAGDYAEQLTADEKASIADKRVEDGSSITLPVLTTEPETDDSAYEFKSWMDGETEVSSPYKVTKDVTLSAKWEKITSRLDNISDLASIAITQNPTVTEYGYEVVSYKVLPDDKEALSTEMVRLCDTEHVELVLTTGGTGLSPRDNTPEATLSVATKMVPGISEAMRAYSMTITKRAMLSRGVSVMRGDTLIVNMPGSPKAVNESLTYIIDELKHGIEIMRGLTGNCARK